MAEKNILVNRGIPRGPSTASSGAGGSGSSSGGTGSFSYNIGLDGNPVGGGGNGAGNVNVMMGEMIEEALLSGQGWPSVDAYTDLGIDIWNVLPMQIEDVRRGMAADYSAKARDMDKNIRAELQSAGVSAASIDDINRSIAIIQDKISKREAQLGASIDKFVQYPDRNFGSRSIGSIMSELRSLPEDAVPGAIDNELAGTQAALEVSTDFYAVDLLQDNARNLLDTKSAIQAIAMAKELARFDARQQSEIHAAEPLAKLDFISDSEGGLVLNAYVPKKNGTPIGDSGVTVGVGVDLGSKTSASLLKDGVPSEVVAVLAEYTGLKGNSADNKLKQKPLQLTDQQATALSQTYLNKTAKAVESRYNAAVGEAAFRDVPLYSRTAIISIAYQYGDNLAVNTPKFWSAVTGKNWSGAVNELKNFGDLYPGRRASEAKLIQFDLDFGYFE